MDQPGRILARQDPHLVTVENLALVRGPGIRVHAHGMATVVSA